MKVAWICHFSNWEVQSVLHPDYTVNEFAPWITNMVKIFENDDNIELHILSPQSQISGYKKFILNGINYHFFNPYFTLYGRSLTKFHLNYRTNFFYLKAVIRKIIKEIKPDLIHLHGAEVDYSSSVFQFKGIYPVFVTVQGFVSHATKKDDYFIRYRTKVEQKIFKDFQHFGYRTLTMGRDILNYNPNAVLHWHNYPIPLINVIKVEKKFDLVFFARVTHDKGIEDLVKCLSLIKNIFPDISLCVIGGTNKIYLQYLADMAAELNVSKNIRWMGYIQNHSDMFKIASSALISVLPTYHDIISGTIIESMLLKLPVVAYNVGSIHEINETGEFVSLIDKGDISAMAQKIITLLKRKDELEDIGERAYYRALKMFDNNQIYSDITNAYRKVIDDFSYNRK